MHFVVITSRYVEPTFDLQMVMEFVLILFVAYYIAQELSEFTISKTEYLQDGWNIIDWMNLILLIVVVVYRVICYM